MQAASDPTGKPPGGAAAGSPQRASAQPLGAPTTRRGPSRYQRFLAVAALAIVSVIVIAMLLGGGDSGFRYHLIFNNGSQLVEGNQVLIGGVPAGSIDSIERTDDNLARVNISLDQQLHEGTTAAARYLGLTTLANRVITLHPGPNSEPPLEDGATLGLTATTSPVEIDQLFNTLQPRVREGLSEFIKGNAEIYRDNGPNANESYRYFYPALEQSDLFLQELNSDQAMFEDFVVSTSQLVTAVSERSNELSSSISNANTAFTSVAGETTALNRALDALPQAFRQSNTTFLNLRAALDDVDPLVETAKPATEELEAYLRNDLRPVVNRSVPVFKDFALVVNRKGAANDANELLRVLPKDRPRATQAFGNSQDAIADFQPTLNYARTGFPDLLSGLGKLGQITGYYDANGHYARVMPSNLNVFERNTVTGVLDPIAPADQYDPFGPPQIFDRCPGAATQASTDNSNPFVNPPWLDSGVGAGDCDPADLPPGP